MKSCETETFSRPDILGLTGTETRKVSVPRPPISALNLLVSKLYSTRFCRKVSIFHVHLFSIHEWQGILTSSDTLFRTVKVGFLYPIFRCPVRNITTKIDGINSFEESVEISDNSLCRDFDLSDSDAGLFVVNPDIECHPFYKVNPFSTCQNDCPGGEHSW